MISFFFLFFLLNQVSSTRFSYIVPVREFNIRSFNHESCNNGTLICTGSAKSGNGYLSLTPEPVPGSNYSSTVTDKVGRVLYHRPVLARSAYIAAQFHIRISEFSNFPGSGDGLTFIFASGTSPSAEYSYGSDLGLTSYSARGRNARQVAIEFDTFKNDHDPDGNHVGVDGISASTSYVAKSLNGTGIELKSGRTIRVRIYYNGKTNMLYVYMGYYGGPLTTVLSHYIVLSELLPEYVYVGFTAATGAFAESHQILKWSFVSVPV